MKILIVGFFLGVFAGYCNADWEVKIYTGNGNLFDVNFNCRSVNPVRIGYGGIPVIECVQSNGKKIYFSGTFIIKEVEK